MQDFFDISTWNSIKVQHNQYMLLKFKGTILLFYILNIMDLSENDVLD